MTILIAFLSALVGGSLTLLGVYLTNRSNTDRLMLEFVHETRNRREDVLRARGEELYELIDTWLNSLFAYYLNVTFVMQGKITYDECYELSTKEGKEISFNYGRINMIINVYFPSTRSAFDKIIEERNELNKIGIAHHHAYESGDTDGSQYLSPYVQRQRSIEQAGETLKMEIINCLRSI